MKRKILIIAIIPVLAGLLALQSCTKYGSNPPTEHFAFTTPEVVAPANESIVHATGTSVDLSWSSTNQSNDAVKADVYFGTANNPPLFKADHNALTLTVDVELGATYYWRIVMKDANGITTPGDTWSFTVFEPIGIFVGTYHTVDNGGYEYDLDFTKKSANVLQTDDYWDSGWHAEFTMDFVNNTFSMPNTVWGTYAGIESGTIDPATGTMTTTYTIYHPVTPTPVAIETGEHIYTKVSK